jgi:anti-sigma regulatory factor (Ser/Thr protein kinase)
MSTRAQDLPGAYPFSPAAPPGVAEADRQLGGSSEIFKQEFDAMLGYRQQLVDSILNRHQLSTVLGQALPSGVDPTHISDALSNSANQQRIEAENKRLSSQMGYSELLGAADFYGIENAEKIPADVLAKVVQARRAQVKAEPGPDGNTAQGALDLMVDSTRSIAGALAFGTAEGLVGMLAKTPVIGDALARTHTMQSASRWLGKINEGMSANLDDEELMGYHIAKGMGNFVGAVPEGALAWTLVGAAGGIASVGLGLATPAEIVGGITQVAYQSRIPAIVRLAIQGGATSALLETQGENPWLPEGKTLNDAVHGDLGAIQNVLNTRAGAIGAGASIGALLGAVESLRGRVELSFKSKGEWTHPETAPGIGSAGLGEEGPVVDAEYAMENGNTFGQPQRALPPGRPIDTAEFVPEAGPMAPGPIQPTAAPPIPPEQPPRVALDHLDAADEGVTLTKQAAILETPAVADMAGQARFDDADVVKAKLASNPGQVSLVKNIGDAGKTIRDLVQMQANKRIMPHTFRIVEREVPFAPVALRDPTGRFTTGENLSEAQKNYVDVFTPSQRITPIPLESGGYVIDANQPEWVLERDRVNQMMQQRAAGQQPGFPMETGYYVGNEFVPNLPFAPKKVTDLLVTDGPAITNKMVDHYKNYGYFEGQRVGLKSGHEVVISKITDSEVHVKSPYADEKNPGYVVEHSYILPSTTSGQVQEAPAFYDAAREFAHRNYDEDMTALGMQPEGTFDDQWLHPTMTSQLPRYLEGFFVEHGINNPVQRTSLMGYMNNRRIQDFNEYAKLHMTPEENQLADLVHNEARLAMSDDVATGETPIHTLESMAEAKALLVMPGQGSLSVVDPATGKYNSFVDRAAAAEFVQNYDREVPDLSPISDVPIEMMQHVPGTSHPGNSTQPREVGGMEQHVDSMIADIDHVQELIDDYPLDLMRTGEGKVGAGLDPSLLRKLGANMYSGDIGQVAVKEGIQNAVDAVRHLGPDGRISLDVDTNEREITITDNGVGMAPETAANQFMDVGGSLKGEGASGGYGLAKVGMLAHAEEFSLVTTHTHPDGRQTTTLISGSGEDWAGGNLYFNSQPAHELADNGTSLRIKFLPEAVTDNEWYPTRNFLNSFADTHRLDAQIETNINGRPMTGNLGKKSASETARLSPPVETFNVDGATIGIHHIGDTRSTRMISTSVLNNGLPQFHDVVFLKQEVETADHVVFDVRPIATVNDMNYPFTTSREALKGEAKDVVENYFKNIAQNAAMRELEFVRNSINNAPKITASAAPQQQGGFNILGRPKVQKGKRQDTEWKVFNTSPENPIETANKVANSDWAAEFASVAARAMDYIFPILRDKSAYVFPNKPTFGGIGMGKKYIGINIRSSLLNQAAEKVGAEPVINRNLILLNPFGMFLESGADPVTLADSTWGTIIHEYAHEIASGHTEEFAGTITRLLSLSGRHQPEPVDWLETMWANILKDPKFAEHHFEVTDEWKRNAQYGKTDYTANIGSHHSPDEGSAARPAGGDDGSSFDQSASGDLQGGPDNGSGYADYLRTAAGQGVRSGGGYNPLSGAMGQRPVEATFLGYSGGPGAPPPPTPPSEPPAGAFDDDGSLGGQIAAIRGTPQLGQIEQMFDSLWLKLGTPTRFGMQRIERALGDLGIDQGIAHEHYYNLSNAVVQAHNYAVPWHNEWTEIVSRFDRFKRRTGQVLEIARLDPGAQDAAMTAAGYNPMERAAQASLQPFVEAIGGDWGDFLSNPNGSLDMGVRGAKMIRGLMFERHVAPSYDAMKNAWDHPAIAQYAPKLHAYMDNFLEVVKYGHDLSQDAAITGMRYALNKIGVPITNDETRAIINSGFTAVYRGQLGGRPDVIFRDIIQPFYTGAKIGMSPVVDAYKRFFSGDSQAMEERGLKYGWLEKGMARTAHAEAFTAPFETEGGNPVSTDAREALARVGDSVHDLVPRRLREGIQGTWLDPLKAYTKEGEFNRIISGDAGWQLAVNEIGRFRAGEIDFPTLMGTSKARTYDPSVQRMFTQAVQAGDDEGAAALMGNQAANLQFRYGARENPIGVRSTLGRIGMMFGTWTQQFVHYTLEGLKNGTVGDRAAFLGRMTAIETTLGLAGMYSGWRFSKWMWHNALTWAGGPGLQAAATAANAIAGVSTQMMGGQPSLSQQGAMQKFQPGQWAGDALDTFNPYAGTMRTFHNLDQSLASFNPGWDTVRGIITGDYARNLDWQNWRYNRQLEPTPLEGTGGFAPTPPQPSPAGAGAF